MVSPTFFESVIGAGAILSGFCGTFLAFRIQREAAYYRQPAVDFQTESARDIYVGLTHFTPPFLLLLLATAAALAFGFIVPLLAIAGLRGPFISIPAVVSGLVAAVTLLVGYFAAELLHYAIISSTLLNDIHEWRKGRGVVIATVVLTAVLTVSAYLCVV